MAFHQLSNPNKIPMADKNKISIDVEVNAEGQQQINQYSDAFEKLNNSISNLSNPISSLDKDLSKLTDSIDKLNSQNQTFASSGNQVKDTIENVSSTFSKFETIIKLVKTSFASLEGAMTGGLTLIAAFGPEILEFITSLTKGKDAIDKAKLSLTTMNNALQSSDYSNAIKQVSELKINVDLAKKGFLDKKEVLQQYNSTIGKTMGQVSNLNDAEAKINKNGPAYIKMTLLKASAQLALQEAAKKSYEAQQDALKSDDDSLNFWDKTKYYLKSGITATFGGPGAVNVDAEIDKIKLAKQRRAEAVTDAKKQRDAFIALAAGYEKEAAKTSKDSGFDFFNGEMSPGGTGSKKKKPKVAKPQFDPDVQKELTLKQMQQTADDFNKQLDQQNNNYAVELDGLKDQLDKKLITQDAYFDAWAKLQDKYHTGISESIKLFNEQDLAQAQQHQQELVEAQKIHDDQHNVNKAILPANKLAAEKQLIIDKYNFEIQKAAEAGKDTSAIREQYQQEMIATDKKYTQERKDLELQAAQQLSNQAFSILQNSIKSKSDAQVKQLETQKTAELSNSSLTSAQKQAIEDKYKKKEAAVKTKAFKDEQKASILQAVINGALAITKASAQAGMLSAFVIPGIIAETAIQVATIAAQKAPQYAKGGIHYKSDGRGALLSGYSRTDNTNAYLRSGEAIVVSEAMQNPFARNLVSAINVAYGGRDFSMTNPSRGYAIGGIFTDGGNSNRYYNQPVNDQKDLANTIAYQMINNFPPVYVDVKDVNNQQNILAQTVNRVNL
jgi:hypothetical protein